MKNNVVCGGENEEGVNWWYFKLKKNNRTHTNTHTHTHTIVVVVVVIYHDTTEPNVWY